MGEQAVELRGGVGSNREYVVQFSLQHVLYLMPLLFDDHDAISWKSLKALKNADRTKSYAVKSASTCRTVRMECVSLQDVPQYNAMSSIKPSVWTVGTATL